jgi:hypothetical protein
MKNIKLAGLLLVLVAVGFSCNDDDDLMNVVPVAEAGPNQTITLPTNTATLTGTGSDADGNVVAYLWSQVSGPAPTIITNPGNPSTTVKFSISGTYVFQLMVTDNGGATGVDTTKVTVNQGSTQTLTLQPASNPNDVKLQILNGTTDQTHNNAPDLVLTQWTNGGQPVTVRSLLKFDLSTIPQSATIVSANLYLYSHPAPLLNGTGNEANWGANNSFTVQRAATDWSPASITWFNQPSGSASGQVTVPHTASSFLDLNLDVTAMVSSMVNNNTNYGFLMKLQNEVPLTSRIFVSSHNTTHTTKYPKLVVVYQ